MKVLNRTLNQDDTRRSYKKVVWFYNFWSWLTESKAAKEVLRLASIKDGANVLEIACGTGVVFEKIVKSNPSGNNTGVDLSPEMLQKARKRLSGLDGHFQLLEGDIFNMTLEASQFDVVINNFMVDLMPEDSFNKLAEAFYKLLKPDGVLVISTFSFGTKRIHRMWYWIAKHFPDMLTGCRPVAFKEYLLNAGFEIQSDIQISQHTFPSEVIKAKKPTGHSNL